MTLIAMVSQ